jgi:hypothetical protein
MKTAVLWDTTSCSLLEASRSFGRKCSLNLQGWRIKHWWDLCAKSKPDLKRSKIFKSVNLAIYTPRTAPGYRNRYNWLRDGRSRRRSSSPGGDKNFHFSMSSRLALGSTQPPIQWVLDALSLVLKRPGRESNYSPPASAEVKKTWVYASTPHTSSWRSA